MEAVESAGLFHASRSPGQQASVHKYIMSITNGHWNKQDNSARAGESRWSQGSGKPYQNRIKTPSGSTESCARLWKALDRSSAGHLSGWARFATSRNQHETRIGADLSKFTRIEPQCPGTGPPGGVVRKGFRNSYRALPFAGRVIITRLSGSQLGLSSGGERAQYALLPRRGKTFPNGGANKGHEVFVLKSQMETYDRTWVEAHVDLEVDTWNESAGPWAPEARPWSQDEQRANEDAYDQGLLQLEAVLRSPAENEERRAQDRIVAAFGQFAARALHLDREATALLTDGFLPVGVSLAAWARRFDPALNMPGIIQAARNAWTACGLQPLLGVPMGLTPSILGYSLIYPYSDNLLDDENISIDAKLRFSRRLHRRLLGDEVPARDEPERRVWALIELIERQYRRSLYPNVFESLLAIHRAQEQSLGQVRGGQTWSDAAYLRVSCAKGGSSVLADACFAYGSLAEVESRFAFEWGVLLQLGDDLQDVREDMRRGSMTLFSRAATEGDPLDRLTGQLLRFGEQARRRMNELNGGSAVFKGLLTTSWQSLILGAVADSSEFFSLAFLREVEPFSPFRFGFLRARKSSLAGVQGLYGKLFSALSRSARDRDHGLPPAENWASPNRELTDGMPVRLSGETIMPQYDAPKRR